jgi:hypothetical protein
VTDAKVRLHVGTGEEFSLYLTKHDVMEKREGRVGRFIAAPVLSLLVLPSTAGCFSQLSQSVS